MLINNKSLTKIIKRIDLTTEQEANLNEISNIKNNIDNKVDKITGKQLSTEDYTSQEKTDLANLKTIVGDNNSGLVKDVADLKENSSGSAGIPPEQLEQINTNKTNISAIQTSLNKKANSADVYNKTQIDTKLSDIQSGNLVLSDSVQQDTSIIAPYEEDEIYGNILTSDSMLYSLDTSVTSVGFKLSKAPREGQTIKLEVNNDEIIIDKTELYFDKNSFNEYQFINISFKENNLNSGNILGYIKAYNNNYNNVYVSIKVKTRNIVSSPIEVASIIINNFVQDLEIGEKRPLSYTITPEDASNKGVSFSSSSSTIATVDECGIITGIAEGEVTITATTNNNKTSTYKVNVVTNRIEKNNLNIYYDLTKYSEGYSGQVEDLSGNNIVPNITGLNLYTTGRCGFIGNKLMLNGTECKFEITNNEYILKHPQTIEIYGKFRSAYNGSIQNDNLSLGNLTNAYYTLMNSRINPTNNGYWIRYFTNKGDYYLYVSGSLGDCTVYKDFKISSANKIYNEDIHLVFEFGKAEQKIYLNGNCIYYGTRSVSDFTDATTKTLYLCSENGIGLDLKYFRLYSNMLDVETIRRNYNCIKEGGK